MEQRWVVLSYCCVHLLVRDGISSGAACCMLIPSAGAAVCGYDGWCVGPRLLTGGIRCQPHNGNNYIYSHAKCYWLDTYPHEQKYVSDQVACSFSFTSVSMLSYMLCVMCGVYVWDVTYEMWCVICDVLYVMCDMDVWCVICDVWYVMFWCVWCVMLRPFAWS